jgi:ABC-type multidrug transport system ATPase subunit
MILTVEHIAKSFGRNRVLKDISFGMQPGTLVGIAGENGAGKSTLLKIIAGEWKPDRGLVARNGRVGYCPQQILLFPQLTVEEHFRYFATAYRMPLSAISTRAVLLMEILNFSRYKKERISSLSGGSQQKVSLSLALLHQPELLILDEPYNGLDWDTYERFWKYTGQLRQEGCAILVVSHLLAERERFDKIYNLCEGVLE